VIQHATKRRPARPSDLLARSDAVVGRYVVRSVELSGPGLRTLTTLRPEDFPLRHGIVTGASSNRRATSVAGSGSRPSVRPDFDVVVACRRIGPGIPSGSRHADGARIGFLFEVASPPELADLVAELGNAPARDT
jgi:hypothetical protein